MNYEMFKTCILGRLKEQYGDEYYEIGIHSVIKNNGIHLDALCILKNGDKAAPNIYLNSYYERYLRGSTLADILTDIVKEYEDGMGALPSFQGVESYYEAVKSQIIMRLVNYEKNQEILEDCPHVPFFDMAITFRWLAHYDEIGISSALISNDDMARWGITLEQIHQDAVMNTRRIFPARIQSLEDLLGKECSLLDHEDLELFVLTNQQGLNGATCILYEDVLRSFARKKRCNFYLLPSSIHEMMICPDNPNVCPQMLLSLVKEANHLVVTMGEVLSDNIYYYNSEKDKLSFIQNYC